MTRQGLSVRPSEDRRLGWENLPERMAPELRIDVIEWVVAEYRRLFPDFTPEQIFFAATTAARSWRGQVIEAEERARAGRRPRLPARLRLAGRALRAPRARHSWYSARSTRWVRSPAPARPRAGKHRDDARLPLLLPRRRSRPCRTPVLATLRAACASHDDLRRRAPRRKRSPPIRTRDLRPHPLRPARNVDARNGGCCPRATVSSLVPPRPGAALTDAGDRIRTSYDTGYFDRRFK